MTRLPDLDGPEIFSTCPQSADTEAATYLDRVCEVARWSEECGCTGTLVYTDNRLVDAWLVAQVILQSTERLCPLVAVQPIYMHPYSVAKKVTSYAFLHGRRIFLNMVAGGFKNDLQALNDTTLHDLRYKRLVEYTSIILELLTRSQEGSPLSFEGEFYRTDKLKLAPPLRDGLMPGVFLSGSSEAGMAAVRALGATGIQYPRPAAEYDSYLPEDVEHGMRIGIIARESSDEAWREANARFPEDRRGQLTHQLAMKVSDSHWHRQLSTLARSEGEHPYWLRPFENYHTMCPYLVGSYESVAGELARYLQIGYRAFILDIPPERWELEHTREAFRRARNLVEAG
jgi:alkanesulfonate monooxygenase